MSTQPGVYSRPMATATSTWVSQAGVIPIHQGKICLVTSSSGKRWVVPKGCLEPGKTSHEIALQEAWEEAGLVGALHPEPVGSFLYEKYGGTCHVTVYVMHVTEAADEWPEQDLREREWLTPRQAIARLDDAGLRQLIRQTVANHN
jgi:8-oxo-dGTP pyrophosphatase MutT (NUDIX family)